LLAGVYGYTLPGSQGADRKGRCARAYAKEPSLAVRDDEQTVAACCKRKCATAIGITEVIVP